MYRTGDHSCHIGQLYQFADNTGILETHKQCLAQPFEDRQVDMKMMYYELIRLLTSYERSACEDMEPYDSTKSVGKIEGYQELTNKMQRGLNQRFIQDIEQLNKNHAGDNITQSGDGKINQKIGDLENKFKMLTTDNKVLNESFVALESTNKVLEHEIEKLKETIILNEDQKGTTTGKFASNITKHQEETDSDESMESEFSFHLLLQKIESQNESIKKLDDKMEKVINQANTLLINDATHLERIYNLERKGEEIDRKLTNLESADLYLQESQRMLIERTSIVEKYSKFEEETFHSMTNQKEKQKNKQIEDSDFHYKQEELENRITVLESSVSDLSNERGIQEEISEFKDKLRHLKVFNNIRNTNTTKITESHEISKNLYVVGRDNVKTPEYSELVNKYKDVLGKVEKMESLLGKQAQSLSEYSELFSEEYFKLLAANNNQSNRMTDISKETYSEIKSQTLQTSSHLEIHSKEFLDENMARDFILMKTEVANLKKQQELFWQTNDESSQKLIKIENYLLQLFGKSESRFSIFEFIDIVVGLNKSLNLMMEDFCNFKGQLYLIRDKQNDNLKKIDEQKQLIEFHETSFGKVFRKIESTNVKEICDYELVSQRTNAMEDIIAEIKQKIDVLENDRINKRTSKTAREVKFSEDTYGSFDDMESTGLTNSKRAGNHKLLGNWLGRQHGTICC